MRLTGQPCSASLSLTVGEEAARYRQLMDFWKTQTVMHRHVGKAGEKEGFAGTPKGEEFLKSVVSETQRQNLRFWI